MATANALIARLETATPDYRVAPHNLDAEQALLGAILVNNDAYYRVSDFLEPEHFFEDLHRHIYETATKLIKAGKIATPITLKTFLGDQDLGGSTVSQYLARLAAEATTVINAQDYGRTVYDLAIRRNLIAIGEDLVNIAYDSPVESSPRDQIEDTERRLYELAENGKYDGGFQRFSEALTVAIDMAAAAYKRDGKLSGIATGLKDLDRDLGGLQASDLVILAGRPGMGKAQPLTAKVKTSTSWQLMGELKLGDELASHDGRPSRVVGIYPQGFREVYRVTFSDGRSTQCCAEHLWRVRHRGWDSPRIVTTEKLGRMMTRRRYQGRLSIDMVSGHFGHADPLPIDPWLLGALLGDGSLKGRVAFSTVESEMLDRVHRAMGDGLRSNYAGHNTYRLVQTVGASRKGAQGMVPNPLQRDLAALGLWNIESHQKFVPESYLHADRPARLELLRGLLDTDGWVEKHGSLRLCTVSRALADGVSDLVRSLGGTCTIATKQPFFTRSGHRHEGQTAYVCRIRHAKGEDLVSLLRKKERAVRGKNASVRLNVLGVEPAGTAECRCIRVSHPDSLYVTDDYVVTHNTALATNIAFNIAKAYQGEKQPDGTVKTVNGGVVGFFSLEMSAEQLATRIIAEQSGVPSFKIRRGNIHEDDFFKITDVARDMQTIPFYIDQTGGLAIAQLAARARRLKRQRGLDVLVVDYLQLLSGSSKKGENRVQELTEITTGLKALAKELSVPILALSQLSRQVEARDDKRPLLSDLRESGSIEQDADVVMFVFREEYYLKNKEPKPGTEEYFKWQDEMARVHGRAEVIIGKQRHGPTGTVQLAFQADVTRFADLADEDKLPDRMGD
jgi:replicative DNA helicase